MTDTGSPAGAPSAADDSAYAAALVREHDRPRYYATLVAPAAIRGDLFAIYALGVEAARVPDQVSEAALGEIRLQWWRDQIAAGLGGEPGVAPVVRAVASAARRHRLPPAPLTALIAARSFDLYSDAPPTVGDLEGLFGEQDSALFQLAAIICGADPGASADAAGHAGIAYGIARRLARFGSDRARARSILPADLLARRGLTPGDVFAQPPRALTGVVADLVALARRHYAEARAASPRAGREAHAAFRPLAVVPSLLARVERLGSAITDRDAAMPDIAMLLRVATARFQRR